MKTIKLIEIIGFATCSLVMWWAAYATLLGNSFATVKESYGGAMIAFGVLALIIALALSFKTWKILRQYRVGNYD